jgi:hypothetical protein
MNLLGEGRGAIEEVSNRVRKEYIEMSKESK